MNLLEKIQGKNIEEFTLSISFDEYRLSVLSVSTRLSIVDQAFLIV